MEIRALDLTDAAETSRWYAAMRAGASAGRESAPIVTETALLASLRTNDTNAEKDRRAFGAWDGPACLGTLTVELGRADNTHIAEVDISVPPAHRRHGIGAMLLAHATGIAEDLGRRTLAGEVNVPRGRTLADVPGGRFALTNGFTSGRAEQRWTLDLPVPPGLLDGLDVPDGLDVSGNGYRTTSWLGVPPDEWLPAFADLHSHMARDALQDDTLILKAHRGHGLGIMAKVANLRQLVRHHPETRHPHTWVAEVNAPMRAINVRFGFREMDTTHEIERSLVGGDFPTP